MRCSLPQSGTSPELLLRRELQNPHGFKAAVTATQKWGKEEAENPKTE